MHLGYLGLVTIAALALGAADPRADDSADEQSSLLIPINAVSDRVPDEFKVAVGDVVEFYAFGGANPQVDAFELNVPQPGPSPGGGFQGMRMDNARRGGRAIRTQFGGMGGVGGGGMGGGGMAGMRFLPRGHSLRCSIRVLGNAAPVERLATLRRGTIDNNGSAVGLTGTTPGFTAPGQIAAVPIGPLVLIKATKTGKASVEVTTELGGSRKETRVFVITVEERRPAVNEGGAKEEGKGAPKKPSHPQS